MELLKMNEKSRCSAYLRWVISFAFRVPPAPAVRAKRCDPLTPPAPAGESADSGPRTPARGEGQGIREKATLRTGLWSSRDRQQDAGAPFPCCEFPEYWGFGDLHVDQVEKEC